MKFIKLLIEKKQKKPSKKGELRYINIMLAPKPSSLNIIWTYLSSRVLPFLVILLSSTAHAATCFLPDCHLETIKSVNEDTIRCNELGYNYSSSGKCPIYNVQDTCTYNSNYIKCDAEQWCLNNGYTITSCPSPKILDIQCPNNLSLYKTCSCPSDYAYSCSGTGYSSGNGTACNGKYTNCNCTANYTWNGSTCVQTHTHSYSCPSGSYSSSSSCTYGTSGTVSKICSCGATSGTCYKCATCTSSSSNYCSVHNTCHGDCCSDGTYEPCEEVCGGNGCSTSSSSSSSGGNTSSGYDYSCPEWVCANVNGVYLQYEGACSKSCADMICGECACEAAGGTLVDGYCTTWCGMCMGDPDIIDNSGFPF